MGKIEENEKKMIDAEMVRQLLKPLRLEEKQGYQDRAIAGGVAKWIPLVKIKLENFAHFTPDQTQTLLQPLAEYLNASLEERKKLVLNVFSLAEQMTTNPASTQSESKLGSVRELPEEERVKDLATPIQYLKGVGPKRANLLKKIGIETMMSLLTHYPRDWQDRTQLAKIHTVKDGMHTTVCGKVMGKQTFTVRRGLNITKVILDDGTGQLAATWFNQPYMRNRFEEGQLVLVYGRVAFSRQWQIMNPDFEILEETTEDQIHTGRIVPLYPSTERLSQRVLRSMQYALLQQLPMYFPSILPEQVVQDQALPEAVQAYRNIHFPADFASLDHARRRLIFEELFLQQIAVARMRVAYRSECAEKLNTKGDKQKAFINNLPFSLTAAQEKSLEKILADLARVYPMHRLLQGDVGSGKTVLAAAAMLAAVDSGLQAAMMAPTEILATQHYLVLKKLVEPLGVTVGLLTSGIKMAERKKCYEALERGEIHILIGTHALTQETVSFRNLGMVVVDEQHRFGVEQRALLRSKGDQPHTLVMTATPIPRTLALTAYGDLDVTVLDELPPGRMPIQTQALEPKQSQPAYQKMKTEIQAGRQGYIIFPLIDESEKLPLKSLNQEFARLQKYVFQDIQMGLLHGRMTTVEKEALMAAFQSGEIQILASTTVVEVGVDVPNATVMIIENADRFGLATLHQLRGRIGRGRYASFCFLIGDPTTEEGRARLRILSEIKDGFRLAEEDLALRGPGEFFGLRQHGMPDLKLANLIRDADQIEIARQYADELIADDPDLINEEHKALRETYFACYSEGELRSRSG